MNDIPEDNIVSLQEENNSLIDSLGLINSQIGCNDASACNFDSSHMYDDGSMNILNNIMTVMGILPNI